MSAAYFAAVEQALRCDEPATKCRQVNALGSQACVEIGEPEVLNGLLEPGRPSRPLLVAPAQVPRRRLNSELGRAALVHAVAHIEFNAINLALDALWRFRGLPASYYSDWLNVAVDEARHFGWLNVRLHELGFSYGDFPAHNGLWEMACKTAHDPLVRMALVPRVLEARGLDVTPGMIRRLQAAGDLETVAILENILAEEEGHVTIGSHWFTYLCAQRGLDAEAQFIQLLDHYRLNISGPLNEPARLRSGFSQPELDRLRNRI